MLVQSSGMNDVYQEFKGFALAWRE